MGEVVVNLHEAQTRLSNLVDRPRPPRKPGGGKGKIWIAEDFDDPLPDDITAGFDGRDEFEG